MDSPHRVYMQTWLYTYDRKLAEAERDVAEAELKVLEEKDADAGQLAMAKE